jgi:hypothetical protein
MGLRAMSVACIGEVALAMSHAHASTPTRARSRKLVSKARALMVK